MEMARAARYGRGSRGDRSMVSNQVAKRGEKFALLAFAPILTRMIVRG
jgi:hypothetical protein